jgi:hypothetical protein
MKINKLIILTVLILIGICTSFLILNQRSFNSLNPQEKQQYIVSLRNKAIQEAVGRGDYRCCIKPPCTMCYMEANPWNNFTPGTCACDDLLAQGKEACPQCNAGLCETGQEEVCKLEN